MWLRILFSRIISPGSAFLKIAKARDTQTLSFRRLGCAPACTRKRAEPRAEVLCGIEWFLLDQSAFRLRPRAAVLFAALCLASAPAFSQGDPLQNKTMTNHLLDRAQSGHVQEQLVVARAFQLGLGVDRDLVEAARWFHKAADRGNPEAQCQLGFLYHMGSGVPRDDREAFMWFQRAAVENYAPAQFDLSLLLLKGLGASPDLSQAVHWLMTAAQQNFPPAQTNLGIYYLRGYGVPPDKSEGVRWLRKAAKHHYAPAEFLMGTMYRTPSVSGLKNNPAQAVYWYRKAAQQQYAPAQNNLGFLYAEGAGVPVDTEEARKWYRLAAEQGYGGAASNLAKSYAGPDNAKPDVASAYFWALVALRHPAVLSPPFQPSVAASLRARLSSEEASRIEAQAQDWLKAHPQTPDAAHDDWFTYLFTEPSAASAQ